MNLKNMKSIILIVLAMSFFSQKDNINESFITLCKVSNDTLRIDYLDSMHGITNVSGEMKGDTLILKIEVERKKKQQSVDIKLEKGVKIINTGSRKYEVDKLEHCPKVYSGEDALEQLKKQKTD